MMSGFKLMFFESRSREKQEPDFCSLALLLRVKMLSIIYVRLLV